jgi:6-phosphogluconate dehydrogenase
MLPAGQVTETVFQEVLGLLEKGDILIDGANSQFQDTIRRAEQARGRGISMLDVGVSGGIIAADHGYPMMIGGSREAFETCRPIFEGMGIAGGWDLVGEKPGAGHYVKMIHNAIEYGMMQAIAEGFDLLAGGSMQYLDLRRIAAIWNHGTIVSSFLMQMVEKALERNPSLDGIAPHVDDSGEGRWSAREAIEHGVPFVANTFALHARFASRDDESLALRLLAAMRQEFGGHAVKGEAEG